MEDAVSKFGFKASVLIVTAIDINQPPTEFNIIALFYISITRVMLESHCEILWANNSGAYLGRQHTADYGLLADVPDKQAVIYQLGLRSKMIGRWIKNSLITDDQHTLRDFRTSYTFSKQDDGSPMFFSL